MQFFGALPTTSDVCHVATFLWTGLLSRWCWLAGAKDKCVCVCVRVCVCVHEVIITNGKIYLVFMIIHKSTLWFYILYIESHESWSHNSVVLGDSLRHFFFCFSFFLSYFWPCESHKGFNFCFCTYLLLFNIFASGRLRLTEESEPFCLENPLNSIHYFLH